MDAYPNSIVRMNWRNKGDQTDYRTIRFELISLTSFNVSQYAVVRKLTTTTFDQKVTDEISNRPSDFAKPIAHAVQERLTNKDILRDVCLPKFSNFKISCILEVYAKYPITTIIDPVCGSILIGIFSEHNE